MTLHVNSNASSLKANNNTSKAANLLKKAVHGLSGGVGFSAPRDGAGAFGMESSFVQRFQGVRKKPIPQDEVITEVTDKFLASASGLARMGGLSQTRKDIPSINPNEAQDSALNAKLGMTGNPILAMDAQANQRAISVMKLLE